MCTALSTSLNRKPPKTHWRRRVRNHTEQLERIVLTELVRTMSELVSQVKDEQSYIIVRERVHRNTAESTNARIKWWSIFQLMVLIGQGFFQVWWLKRFFEVTNTRASYHRSNSIQLIPSTGEACCLAFPLLSYELRAAQHLRFLPLVYALCLDSSGVGSVE